MSSQVSEFLIGSLLEMDELAQKLAKFLKKGDVVTLNGNLGAGKTTFAGFLINAKLQQKSHVTSPTFNLVQVYENLEDVIWHFDLYRLESKEGDMFGELCEIGMEEAFEKAISIVEWPEKIIPFLLKPPIDVHIKDLVGEKRMVVINNLPEIL